MKNLVFVMFCFVSLTGCCAVQHQWVCETSEVSEESITAYHGETVELQCRMTSYGKSVGSCGSAAEFLWQTNGMGNAWWKTNAVSRSGCVSFNWTPYQDCGADRYTFFFRVTDPKGTNYRANGTISLLGSPSGDVRYLPLPTKVIDFASVSVENPTNAPWMMKGAEIVTPKQVTNISEHVEKEGVRTNWLCTVSVAQQKADEAKAYAYTVATNAEANAKAASRPNTWMPTAAQVGARPDDWMPSTAEVGALPAFLAMFEYWLPQENLCVDRMSRLYFGSSSTDYYIAQGLPVSTDIYMTSSRHTDPSPIAQLADIPTANTFAGTFAAKGLTGQSFNLSNQADFNRAVSNIVTILGGTVTGMP